MAKWVYMFTEGNANMRNLLGGKGANLAEMTNLGLPVPQGFTITTEACTQYYEDGRQINDELLAAVGKLTAEYGRIGGNLNQIARTLNEWHSPYPQLAGEIRAAVSDLAALKFEVLQKVGDAVGNIQTYQL